MTKWWPVLLQMLCFLINVPYALKGSSLNILALFIIGALMLITLWTIYRI